MDTRQFPDTVKVLSWNYDFQLELASQFLKLSGESINHSQNGFIHTPSMLKYYPNLDPTFRDYNNLSLIHLNGIAGYGNLSGRRTYSLFDSNFKTDGNEFMSFLTNNERSNLIHFAWEKSEYHEKLMEHVYTMISGITIMVIIGYSFPFYNREIDKQIFEYLYNNGSLKKIYYQDPILDGSRLSTQFQIRPNVTFEHIKQTDNFHIPFEY